jgi:phosphatidylglycerophosphate synthase
MLDSAMRRRIDPGLNAAGRRIARLGVSANQITLAGLALGLLAAGLIAAGAPGWVALLPLLAGRLADGLDGAVARATGKTGFGGYLDIVCDFAVYGAVPLAFVLRDPQANALAGAFLLASFYLNGATFLGFAVLAAQRGLETRAQGEKSLYYAAGLLEGTETILFFILLCLLPLAFAPLAWAFGGLCLVTALARVALAWRVFGGRAG